MKYKMSWVQKDGTKIDNQIYTAEHISARLMALEKEGASEIRIESIGR